MSEQSERPIILLAVCIVIAICAGSIGVERRLAAINATLATRLCVCEER